MATGASVWGADVDAHPWTIGWQPDYVTEAQVYADFLKKEKPHAKVAVLYQNDGFGKDLLGGFEEAIEGTDIQIVAQRELRGHRPDGRLADAQARAPRTRDTFLNITTPKSAAQAIAAVAKSDWKPLHILNNVGASKTLVLEPVGLENAKGIVSTAYFKDPEDPQWADDAAMKEYKEGMKKYAPQGRPDEPFYVYGWAAASTMVEALKAMKAPTREALMDVGAQHGHRDPAAPAGHQVKTGEGDGYPIQAMQIMRFEGENWELQGEVIQAGT